MSNSCYTNITFKGDKADIQNLYKRLNDIMDYIPEIKTKYGSEWLGNIVMGYGIDYNGVNCNGAIVHISEIDLWDNKVWYFEIITATVCGPMMEMWDLIIKNNYSIISYVYLAEEPDCEIYVNSDIERGFYKVDYIIKKNKLDNPWENIESFRLSSDETLKKLNEIGGKNFSSINAGKVYLERLTKFDNEGFYYKICQYDSGACIL